MRLNRFTLIVISGTVWFFVGLLLLILGVNFTNLSALHSILHAFPHPLVENAPPAPALFPLLMPHLGLTGTTALFMGFALCLGYLKGKVVLAKSVRREVARIMSAPSPTTIRDLYSKGYLFLLAGMMCLGFLFNLVGLSPDIRGMIDIALGSALFVGALAYFRQAIAMKRRVNTSPDHL